MINKNNSLFTLIFAIISLYLLRILPVNTIIFIGLILILFCVTGLMLLGIISVMLLDKIYRPNIPQYPFNFLLDRVIPIIMLICPTIFIIFLSPFDAWFTRFTLLLVTHIFILIPLLYQWSSLRRWNSADESCYDIPLTYHSWNHPCLYLDIAIALIYPSLWGMYFSLSRYIRIGSTINIYTYISSLNPHWSIVIFLFPYWLPIFLIIISTLRSFLWKHTYKILYSLHINAISFNPYFNFMEKFVKLSHLCFSLISLNGLVYFKDVEKYSWWRKSINYMFFHSGWFTFIFFISILLELLLSKGLLHYGIYTLFIYPLIRSILSFFFSIGNHNWVLDCCLSDYVRRQWESPRYPIPFWEYFRDAEFYFNFTWYFTKEEFQTLLKKVEHHAWHLRKKVSRNVHQDLLYYRVRRNFQHPFGMRLAVSYLYSHRVRWVHTGVFYHYHSATALFVRSLYDRAVLVNSCWKHVLNLQVVDKNTKLTTPQPLYLPFGASYPFKEKNTFIKIQEENTPTHFIEWLKRGVIVEPYDETNPTHITEFKSQSRPDLFVNFNGSEFTDQRCHTLDQKTGNPGLGKHKLLSEITVKRYETTINNFEKDMKVRSYFTDNMAIALRQLKETCLNIEQHQLVWAKSLHLYHSEHIPPIKLPQNFNTSQFTPEALSAMKNAELRMIQVSDYLFFKKVPQTSHGIFPKEALDLFNDSYIQKIFQDYPID
jgi:hypothetical protein